MAAATRRGRFGEYNYRCACIAQLVEQLTLNQRTLVDACGRLPTDSNQLFPRRRLTTTTFVQMIARLDEDFIVFYPLVGERDRSPGSGQRSADSSRCQGRGLEHRAEV